MGGENILVSYSTTMTTTTPPRTPSNKHLPIPPPSPPHNCLSQCRNDVLFVLKNRPVFRYFVRSIVFFCDERRMMNDDDDDDDDGIKKNSFYDEFYLDVADVNVTLWLLKQQLF